MPAMVSSMGSAAMNAAALTRRVNPAFHDGLLR
ncbi:MAG: hypothetical protein ACI8RE_000866 [Ilumatobacter sp.]